MLPGNGFGALSCKSFGQAICTSRSLTVLNLNGNKIDDEGAKYLASGLIGNQSLKQLHLSENFVSSDGCWQIVKSLKTRPGLQMLLLTNNFIRDDVSTAVIDLLRTSNSIEVLSLHGNFIRQVNMDMIESLVLTSVEAKKIRQSPCSPVRPRNKVNAFEKKKLKLLQSTQPIVEYNSEDHLRRVLRKAKLDRIKGPPSPKRKAKKKHMNWG